VSPWDAIRDYARKPERLVLGLMSGTSLDGIDAALVRIAGSRRSSHVAVVAARTYPLAAALYERVLALSTGIGDARTLSALNVEIGHALADAASGLLKAAGISPFRVDAIASHGQTVSHTPLAVPYGATLQIGEPAVLCQRLGIPVVSDFRASDVAAGGQGAPLVPYADWCLLTHATRSRAVQNIGGIANVTYLPADGAPASVVGFDTGPGNMLIDRATWHATGGRQSFDAEGRLAARGAVDAEMLTILLEDTFLHLSPPKSAGREQYHDAVFDRLAMRRGATISFDPDLVATITAFTAHSIASAYRQHLPAMPDEVIVGGGGARNPTLMHLLAAALSPIPVYTHEHVGIDSEIKEALAFALLANETLLGNPANLPSVTGALHPVILGKLTVPSGVRKP